MLIGLCNAVLSFSDYLNCNKFDDNSRPIIGEKETAGSIHDAYFVNKKEGTHTLTDVSTIQFVDISFFRSFLSICGRSQRRAVHGIVQRSLHRSWFMNKGTLSDALNTVFSSLLPIEIPKAKFHNFYHRRQILISYRI